MNIGFERPLFVLAALIAIPGLFFVLRFFKPVFSLRLPLGPPGGASFTPPVNLGFLTKFLRALELAGVVLLCIAAAGPRFVFTETVWLNRGADILFVMDVSPSMSALDMDGGSRFDTARTLLRQFSGKRPQDAIGLIAFGQDAAILTPLTTDRASLYHRMDTLAIGEMGDATAIGTSLALAGFHIGRSEAPRRAVVLITDGENNAGSIHPETAAAMLAEMGVSLWVIGVGSSGMVPFSYVDPATGVLRTGMYDSHFDPETLERIALSAQGFWIHAPTAEAFAGAFSRLDQGEMVIRRSGSVRREEPFHAIFIIAALAVLWGTRFVRRRVLGAIL
ncbi:MAG: VWA domain-containing protein [Treponema sp.]|nr:VWA domain-containing protein [Treponema sp.]